MKYSVLTALLTACAAVATPLAARNPFPRATAPTDVQVLQYALTLENLEAAYYQQALAKFSAADFANAGFPDWVRGRASQIGQHEKSHATLLSAALGNMTVAPCTYNFAVPFSDVKTFVLFSSFLENIGVSAYAGANQYISTAAYRTVAATILSVEARHQGFWSGPALLQNDWSGPYDTPLGLDMVYTLAAQLISSCPSSNAMLPVTASTPLTSGGLPIAVAQGGASLPLAYTKSSSSVPGPVMAAIYNGLGSTMVPYNNGAITLPNGIQGISYIILTNAGSIADVSTANTVAGPLVLSSPFNAGASNPGYMNPYGS